MDDKGSNGHTVAYLMQLFRTDIIARDVIASHTHHCSSVNKLWLIVHLMCVSIIIKLDLHM